MRSVARGCLSVSESACDVATPSRARSGSALCLLGPEPFATDRVSGLLSEGGSRPLSPGRPLGRRSPRGARAPSPLTAHERQSRVAHGPSVSAGSRALSSLMAHGPSVPRGTQADGVSRLTGPAVSTRSAHGPSGPVRLTGRRSPFGSRAVRDLPQRRTLGLEYPSRGPLASSAARPAGSLRVRSIDPSWRRALSPCGPKSARAAAMAIGSLIGGAAPASTSFRPRPKPVPPTKGSVHRLEKLFFQIHNLFSLVYFLLPFVF